MARRRPRESAGIRCRQGAGGLSHPVAGGAREAADLPRQRRQRPETARRDRRRLRRLRGGIRQHPPGCALPERAGDGAPRRGPREGPGVPQRGGNPRDRVHQERDRGDQPRGQQLRGATPSGGRRDPADRARAPRQYRALAARGRTRGRRGQGRTGGRRRPRRSRGFRGDAHPRARGWWRSRISPTCWEWSRRPGR